MRIPRKKKKRIKKGKEAWARKYAIAAATTKFAQKVIKNIYNTAPLTLSHIDEMLSKFPYKVPEEEFIWKLQKRD